MIISMSMALFYLRRRTVRLRSYMLLQRVVGKGKKLTSTRGIKGSRENKHNNFSGVYRIGLEIQNVEPFS